MSHDDPSSADDAATAHSAPSPPAGDARPPAGSPAITGSVQDAGPPYRIARLGRDLGPAALEGRVDLDVRRFDGLERLLAEGRRLQPRVCVVEPDPERDADEPVEATVRRIRRDLPLTDVVYWLPDGDAAFVRRCFLAGARDVLISGSERELADRVTSVVEHQTLLPRMLDAERTSGTWRFGDMISRSQRMLDVFESCARTAATEAPVLVLGETGTGKELIARAIHRRSGRTGPFVPLNCGAVPETLIDSELFGHVEGAFTGARKAKDGLFRHAEGGTLFLDEIGNIPMEAQNRLLRTLQENAVRPVGGHDEVPIDVRVIAATSVPLEREIEAQRFREDLFYRIDVIRLILPPLRERPEDVILLLGRFLHDASVDYAVRRPTVGDSFLDRVCEYAWPGNVRELENFVERVVLTHPGERLGAEQFDELMRGYEDRGTRGDLLARGAASVEAASVEESAADERSASREPTRVDLTRPLADHLRESEVDFERRYLTAALEATRGRVGEAAELAGIHRRTLRRKMERHGLDKADFRRAPFERER